MTPGAPRWASCTYINSRLRVRAGQTKWNRIDSQQKEPQMKNPSSPRPASTLSFLFAAAALSAPLAGNLAMAAGREPQAATVSVFATGLNNPRGLKFGPDGNLYVAEGGTGGTNSTIGQCTQIPATGPGPSTGSDTGSRISKIDWQRVRT